MNIREESDSSELVLELTPLIDVVFLLLIFFMVTTTFLDPETEIEVELPVAESAGEPQEAPEEIVVNVTADGRLIVRGETLTKEELLAVLKRTAQHDPATPVTIRGHRAARHDAVVGVMDACGLAGLSNLAVGTLRDEGAGRG